MAMGHRQLTRQATERNDVTANLTYYILSKHANKQQQPRVTFAMRYHTQLIIPIGSKVLPELAFW